jgi:hypothetical protein
MLPGSIQSQSCETKSFPYFKGADAAWALYQQKLERHKILFSSIISIVLPAPTKN